MKQILTLAAGLLLFAGSVLACPKNRVSLPEKTTILVMDTTQALLEGAEVQIGSSVFHTSWDGRLIVEAAQWSGAKKVKVSCEGYEPQTLSLSDVQALTVVSLTPKKRPKGQSGKEEMYYTLGAPRERKVMYKTATVEAAEVLGAVADKEGSPSILPALVANDVAAGKLTAGEVNDFAKWSLWSDILDKSHAQYIQNWNIVARDRYTVQVVDKHGYPVAVYPVNLTDAKGNTLFQAVTDNTGKAELWNGLIAPAAEGVQVQVGGQLLAAQKWLSVTVDEPCRFDTDDQSPITNDQSDVDVVFVFDATGSMGDELRYLQAEMKDVIARASAATGGLKIRTGAVVYRDHGDEYVTRISRLTESIATTQTFIDKQEANGGGDYPEAVPEALMAALNSSGWNERARARIAFLVLDAPCHQDSATLALLHDQILNAAALGVRIVPVVCSGLGESGELLLRSMALATNGTTFFLTDDSGIGHNHLKPTTDSLKVEHLNDMLVRTIVEFSYMPDCKGKWHEDQIEQISEQFIPNPFDAPELAQDETIPHGPTTLYLLDVSGKLICIYQGVLEEASDSQLASLHLSLSTGVYFVKAFYDGTWHVKKILVH